MYPEYSLPVAKPARRPTSPLPLLIALLFGVAVGLGVYRLTEGRFVAAPALDPNASLREVSPKSAPDAEENESITVFRDARDSVVNVDTITLVRGQYMGGFQEQQTGTGSGFVWDKDGRIVTNFHVVKTAIQNRLRVRVVMSDRTVHDATVIGVAPDYDLAVLQINAPKESLHPIRVGTSADLQVGQKTYAIGNPFGLSLTMTKGIISALDREIESPGDRPIEHAIQTDAPINPGNSGGPLLDKDGRLIGVNTSIATPSGGNVGIGFAIPVDTVNPVVTELIRTGKLPQPDIGLKLVDQRRLRRAGYPNGVMVQQVDPQGPAARAGLRGLVLDPRTGDAQPGDLILAIDGSPVSGNQEFLQSIAKRKPGETVKLTIERGEEQSAVTVTLRGV